MTPPRALRDRDTAPIRSARLVWALIYVGFIFAGLLIAAFAARHPLKPFLPAGLAMLLVLVLLWVSFPRVALGGTITLALIGDIVTVGWFPFTKNLSSSESILYVSDSIPISPFEISLVVAL